MNRRRNLRNTPAPAYIDPGTGSMVFQMVIAGALGGLFALKTFWSRIRAFLYKSWRQGARRDDR